MEIIDFLKAARRRLWLVILLPLVGTAATAGLLLAQPPTYTAMAVVDPPALVGGLESQYTGAQGVNQFVAAFQATASGPVVRRAVSDRTGVSTVTLNDNLGVTQRGTSASLSVTFTSDRRDTVVPVLEEVTRQTLGTMFDSQVQSAEARVGSAKTEVDKATAAIAAFTAKNNMADPQKAYEAQLSRVNSLVQQQASVAAAGNAVGAAALAGPIATAKAELAKFGPILSEYSTLLTARETAVQDLQAANAKLSANTVQRANADPAKIVNVSGAHTVDRLPQVLETTASVGAAELLLALVLVLILEVVARGRVSRARSTEGDRTDLHQRGPQEPKRVPVETSAPPSSEVEAGPAAGRQPTSRPPALTPSATSGS